jgi:hypothetical protein
MPVLIFFDSIFLSFTSRAKLTTPYLNPKPGRTIMQYKYAPFLVIGIVFVVLGASGQRTLLWVGIVFLILAVAMFRRKRL